MRAIVTDTNPLHYLVLTGTIDILPRLFEHVIAPDIVRAELSHREAPDLVRAWAATVPNWLVIMPTLAEEQALVSPLDAGERAVIALAERVRADLVLMDDRDGVAAAPAAEFLVTGTLGLFARAADRGLVELATAFSALRATNFRDQRALYDQLLARERARRSGG